MVAITPTSFLQHHLDPLSKQIDSFGGPHMVMGIIASGGEPHVYVTGNVSGNLKKEICEALAFKLNEMAGGKTAPSMILQPGVL